MSEKLYALLLRLYPASFRAKYGKEALWLFRERLRHEHGFFCKTRFWFELALDLAWSLPQEHRYALASPVAVSAESFSGEPLFQSLDNPPPRPGAFLSAAFLALLVLGSFGVLLKIDALEGPLLQLSLSSSSSESGRLAQSEEEQSAVASQSASPRNPLDALTIDAAERQRVISGVVANLRQHYQRDGATSQIENALWLHERNGDYGESSNARRFALQLSTQVQQLSGDSTLVVLFGDQSTDWKSDPSRLTSKIYRIDAHFAVFIP